MNPGTFTAFYHSMFMTGPPRTHTLKKLVKFPTTKFQRALVYMIRKCYTSALWSLVVGNSTNFFKVQGPWCMSCYLLGWAGWTDGP